MKFTAPLAAALLLTASLAFAQTPPATSGSPAPAAGPGSEAEHGHTGTAERHENRPRSGCGDP